jgi:hypothetical protein
MNSSGSFASAMAIITRWRWPPESWWGELPSRLAASRMPTRVEQVEGALARLPAIEALVKPEDLADLPLDRVQRVQATSSAPERPS